jgi:ubiquinone/menaquinone biosynthesis C-methylase UbiE/molybdopterin converting factor small subunit
MKIKVMGLLARKIGKEVEIELNRELTLPELVEELVKRFPEAKEELSDPYFYNFSVNGVIIRHDDVPKVRVKNEDTVVIIPSIAGGSKAVKTIKAIKVKGVIKKNFDVSASTYTMFEEKYGFFTSLARDMVEFADFGKGFCLDVGCGTGILRDVLPDSEIVGLDISTGMLKEARSRLDHVLAGDAEHLPFRDGSFDAVLFNATIFLIPHADIALKEALRVVKEGGVVAGSYLVGFYHNGRNALEMLGLKHREVFPSKKLDEVVKEMGGEIEEFSYSGQKDVALDFYSVPAMSNALFPGQSYEERLKLVREKLSALPDEIEFVWKMFRI